MGLLPSGEAAIYGFGLKRMMLALSWVENGQCFEMQIS